MVGCGCAAEVGLGTMTYNMLASVTIKSVGCCVCMNASRDRCSEGACTVVVMNAQ